MLDVARVSNTLESFVDIWFTKRISCTAQTHETFLSFLKMSPSSIALEAVVAVLLLVEGRSGRTDGLPEDRTLYCQAVRTDTAAKRRTQTQLTEERTSQTLQLGRKLILTIKFNRPAKSIC